MFSDMGDGVDDFSSDDDSDLDDGDTVQSDNLSTESQVQRVEGSLTTAEKAEYSGLSEEEKMNFLLKKKAENRRVVSK